MARRQYRNPGGRAVSQRAIAVQGMHRALAAAELHRDRDQAGIVRLEAFLAEREALGLSDESALAHLARLRIALAASEAEISGARRSLGLDRAAA